MKKINFYLLNPFRITGTPLPANLLLMAKIIVLGLLLKGYAEGVPQIFLPFFPTFDWIKDHLISGWRFHQILEIIFLFSAAMILCNQRVKLFCFTLALVIFIGILANQFYYSNNRIYAACMLLWAGLHIEGSRHRFLEWQIALMYLGAGANKLLDMDWRSGVYFDHWMKNIIHQTSYEYWASLLPPLLLGKLMGWTTILTELSLSVGFFLRRLQPLAIWGGILLHANALILSGKDFQIYTIAIWASYLTFITWPQSINVSYNPQQFFGRHIKPLLAQLDFDHLFKWQETSNQLSVVTKEKTYTGFAAVKILLWFLPAHYFILTALMCIPQETFRSTLVATALLFYSPLIDIISEIIQRKKLCRA